jgi:hypothetical protein
MEEYKNCSWTELSNEQTNDIKTRIEARCVEQGLPRPQTSLIKALVSRIHTGTLSEPRSRFIKRQPEGLLPYIKKQPMA